MRTQIQTKIIGLLLGTLLCWWLGVAYLSPVQAAPGEAAIEIKANVGINGEYKWGQIVPIHITLTNRGENTVEGKVELSMPPSSMSMTNTLYVTTASLAKGESKTVFFRVPGFFTDSPDAASIRWIQDGKVINEQKITPIGRNNQAIWTGILASDNIAATLLQTMKKEKKDTPVQPIQLTPDNLTQDILLDSGLNVILIEQGKFAGLQNTQKQAIQSWAGKGGLLLTVDPAQPAAVWPQVAQKASVQKETFLDKATELGRIATHSFAASLPSLPLLILLLVIYIIIIGPVAYFIMRRLGVREWNWVFIPLASIAMLALVYGYGTWHHGTNTRVHNVNVIEVGTNGNAHIMSSSAIFAPYAGEYRIQLPKNVDVFPSEEKRALETKESPMVTTNPGGDTETTLPHINKWSLGSMYAQQNLPNSGAFEADFKQKGDRLVGTIRNGTSYSLQDARIVFGDSIQSIPTLAPGAVVQVDLPMPAPKSESRYYDDTEFAARMLSQNGEEKLQQARLQLMRMMYDSRNSTTVTLLGWTDQHPLQNKVADRSYKVSNVTLVTAKLAQIGKQEDQND